MQSDAIENIFGRKRQRSTSGASESGGSSPKRAASEGPSLTSEPGVRSSTSVEPQPFSNLSIIEDHDVDTYMATQDTASVPPFSQSRWRGTPVKDKLNAFATHSKTPLEFGQPWYMVASRWFKDWGMACRGQADKQGPRDEATLGPVDNAPLIDLKGDLKPDLLDGTDFELVPKSMWSLFEEWYGPAKHVLERKVTTRGSSQELFVECYVPRFKFYRLCLGEETSITGKGETRTVQISLRAPVRDLFAEFEKLFNVARMNVRYWRVTDLESESGNDSGLDYPVGRLRTSGAEPFNVANTDLDKAMDDLLLEPSDVFIVEVKENNKWIIDIEQFLQQRQQQQGTSTPNDLAASAQTKDVQLFNKSGGFFGEMSNRMGIAPSESASAGTSSGFGTASSSILKPPVSIAARAKPTQNSRVPGTLGLGNLGNTCFMNSALQCLAHTKELTDYFLTELYREELNRDNPLGMGGAIAENFGSLLTRIWSSTSGPSSYAPREFKQQLQRFAPQFSGYQQHDSQELVAFLLDGLHEDLNRVLKKPYVENPDWEGGEDKELVELAQKSWDGYISRNDSAIVDLFQGQYKSTLVCPECQKVSITFDPFMYLTLPLPIKKKWRHDIYYIPWDVDKPHLRIPIELDYDASFKEMRRMLGTWMGSNPDHLMTLEIFQHKFYKYLDDGVPVSDMGSNDHIVCFEMPCKTHMNEKAREVSDDDMLILPVYTSPIKTRSYSSSPELIGHPFLVALSREQASSLDSIYAAVVNRLQRWTNNAKSLFKYVGVDHIPDAHVVPIVNGANVPTSVTEIRENGDVIVTQAPHVEEADIADEKSVVLGEEDVDMVEVNSSPVTIGPQADLFSMQLCHFSSTKTSMESGAYATHPIPWEERQRYHDRPLVIPGDILFCKWDESLQSYFFNEHSRWDKVDFEEFVHPEYEAQRRQAEKKTNDLTVDDCLDEFTKEEQLGEDDPWYCPQCKKHQQATKNLQLWKVPDVLVVHLKRFSNTRIMRDKLDAFIDFPLRGLDLEERVGERRSAKVLAAAGHDVAQLGLDDINEPLLYDLFAVDEHLGGLGGGHYRAYAQNHVDEKWYHFEDSHVSRCKPTDAINRNAYLLFYRRRTTSRPIGGKTHAKIQAARHSHTEKSRISPTPSHVLSPSLLSQPAAPVNSHIDFPIPRQDRTSVPLDYISSTSSSPPELEEADGPPGLEDETYDPLEQSNLRYSMSNTLNGFQGRASSPTSSSSNEAEDGGSETGVSPSWPKRKLVDFPPSPPFAKAVLKPASFGPNYGDVGFTWGAGQEPPSPPSRSISELGDSRLMEHGWDSDDAFQSQPIQLGPNPGEDHKEPVDGHMDDS